MKTVFITCLILFFQPAFAGSVANVSDMRPELVVQTKMDSKSVVIKTRYNSNHYYFDKDVLVRSGINPFNFARALANDENVMLKVDNCLVVGSPSKIKCGTFSVEFGSQSPF